MKASRKPRKSKKSRELLERARALHQSGRTQEAEALYARAIARDARDHEALFALSVLLFETSRFQDCTRCLERAVSAYPNHPKYLNNLGEAYRRQGNYDQAKATFARLLARHPEAAEARQNLAVTFIGTGEYDEALAELERAIALRPEHAISYVSRAWVLLQLHRVEEAAASARRASELEPHLASSHRYLAEALELKGDKEGAIASYRRALELNPTHHVTHSSLILTMLTDPRCDAKALGTEARAWAKVHAEPFRAHRRSHANTKAPERRLRIGYVSPDFRAHAVQQFLVPLLEHHDRSAFEIFLYSSVNRPDAETEWYRNFAGDNFRDIRPMEDADAAELVRLDRIDILVDLALHTAGGRLRLFACKPAPVQITWLGYAGTTGLDTIDYRITDPHIDPPGTDLSVYSEKCLHLPETSWCYASLDSERSVASLPALTNGHITFGCQNSPRKLHPQLLRLWARLLSEVPDARLFLYAEDHDRVWLRRTLAQSGVEAHRIEFGGRVPRPVYFERYNRIDIGLDTFPFNGATTTLDAVRMGVPVVTLVGDTSLQRAGACIAANLGLPQLIAYSEEDFVEKAVALTQDLPRLSDLRAALRSRLESSPLSQQPRFAHHLEAAYRTAWQRYCEGA